jgi:hypothetical protein
MKSSVKWTKKQYSSIHVLRFSQLNMLCSDCGCLRLRQRVGSYHFGGTCCFHLQSQSDGLLTSWAGGQPRGCGWQ